MPGEVFISAGEVSGDIAGALLARALLARDPGVRVSGIGGHRMVEAGVAIAFASEDLGAVGLIEALGALASAPRAFLHVRRSIRARRPDVAVLIGNDVFNICLARWLKSRGIRTVAFFAPQVWVWRSLAGPIANSYDAILVCFPAERAVYERVAGTTPVAYVGHYLTDILHPRTDADRLSARRVVTAGHGDEVVGLFPGSRWQEIRALVPVMLDAASRLRIGRPVRFVLSVADARFADFIERQIRARALSRVVFTTRDSRLAMTAADLLLVASGTASLEAALLGVPMIISYKVSPLTHVLLKAGIRLGLFDSYRVGLPNLILGRPVVPELLQTMATADSLADEAERLLSDPARRQWMRSELAEVASRISGPRSVERAAEFVLSIASKMSRAPHLPATARSRPSSRSEGDSPRNSTSPDDAAEPAVNELTASISAAPTRAGMHIVAARWHRVRGADAEVCTKR